MAIKTSWTAGQVLAAADLTDTFAAKLGTLTVNAQTGTTYTLTTTDPQKVVTMTNAAASAVTVPTDAAQAVTIGSQIEIVNLSTGVPCTVAPAGGVTLHGGSVVLSPGSSVTLAKIGTDAWMVQGQGAPGLTLVASATASAAASVSINGCFSAAYETYLLVATYVPVSASYALFRMRLSGTDNSAASYAYQELQVATSTLTGAQHLADTSARLGYVDAGYRGFTTAYISNPAVAAPTLYTSAPNRNATPILNLITGNHSVTTAYDGITVFPSTGNFTGTIRVYGYRNA